MSNSIREFSAPTTQPSGRASPPAALTRSAGRDTRPALGNSGKNKSHRNGDGLDLGVVAKGVFTQFASDAGHLESAEGGGSVEDVVAVDPDRAGPQLGGHAVRPG